MLSNSSEETIELRVDDIAQLFHTLDPFPFRERDLDREAEEYIVASRGVPTLFFGSGGVHSKGHQRTFPGWPAVAFHRAHDTGPEFAAGALCRRRVVREPVAAIAGGEPADPGVGCELAAAGDFPVRMVAACPAARPLRATFQSRHRNKAISRRRVVAGRGKRERSLQRSARPHLRAQLIQINVVGAGRLTLNLS